MNILIFFFYQKQTERLEIVRPYFSEKKPTKTLFCKERKDSTDCTYYETYSYQIFAQRLISLQTSAIYTLCYHIFLVFYVKSSYT